VARDFRRSTWTGRSTHPAKHLPGLLHRHAAEVFASTLYEAATLAMAEFGRSGFTENAPGVATRLMLANQTADHDAQGAVWGKGEAWLHSGRVGPGGFEDV
jgi:hypothetical protein